jgi:hypothetical protein
MEKASLVVLGEASAPPPVSYLGHGRALRRKGRTGLEIAAADPQSRSRNACRLVNKYSLDSCSFPDVNVRPVLRAKLGVAAAYLFCRL